MARPAANDTANDIRKYVKALALVQGECWSGVETTNLFEARKQLIYRPHGT